MENYWRDQASKVSHELHNHPWNELFITTLANAMPERYAEYSSGGFLTAWALVKTDAAMRMYNILIDDGMSEEDASAEALRDTLATTPGEDMQYSQEDVDAADEEAAFELMDSLTKNQEG